MGRRALIYRSYHQSWLARNIASRQPLTARVKRHQRLLQVLGFTGPTAEALQRTSVQSKLRIGGPRQGSLLPTRSVFRQPLIERAKGELERVSSLQMASAKSAYQFVEIQDQEEAARGNQPAEPGRIEVLEVQDRHHLQGQQSAEKRESSASEPDVRLVQSRVAHQLPEISEPAEVKFQQEHEGTDAPAQPEERARVKRTRGRIEEHPAEIGPVLASPPASPVTPAHSDDQATKALERPVVDVAAMSKEEIAADELFAPRDTDRSPQAWIARLNGTRSPAHNDVASPHAKAETLQGDGQSPSIGSEQAAPSKTRESLAGTSSITLYQDEQNVMVPPADARSHSSQFLAEPRQAESGPQRAGSNRFVPGPVRDISQVRPASTPLSMRTRRFLQPLLGFDLNGVRVHRDATAGRLTDMYQADAVTVGDDVELAAGHPDDTPETLGLLAHEFTHVARRRESHFIPPIARSLGPRSSRASQSSLVDEETLALRVESQVNWTAQEQVDQLASIPDKLAGDPIRTTPPAPGSQSVHDTWGGLPAPWEPLPDWLITMPATAESSVQPPFASPQPSHIAYGTDRMDSGTSEAHNSRNMRADVSPDEIGVQRAGRERSPDREEEQKTPSRPEATKAPEPNLDELARQVYSLLKRRLGVEYRRER